MIAYVPVYCCTNRIPDCFAAGKGADGVTFSWDNSFWVCNWVSNMIYPRYNLMIGDLRAVQGRWNRVSLMLKRTWRKRLWLSTNRILQML